MRSLILAIVSLLFTVSAFADGIFQKTGITGKVTVSKGTNGKASAVTISNEKNSFTFSPVEAVDKNSGKKFRITQEDIDKIAIFDGQLVHVALTAWNGKPIDVSAPAPVAQTGNKSLIEKLR